MEEGKDYVVGVNKYSKPEKEPIEFLKIDFKAQRRQVKRLGEVRRERDQAKVRASLAKLERAFEDEDANSIYPMLEAVTRYATLGEVTDVGRRVWGTFKEPMLL